jgi:hypothetical protein
MITPQLFKSVQSLLVYWSTDAVLQLMSHWWQLVQNVFLILEIKIKLIFSDH